MGLDMYLEADVYIGGSYEHRDVQGSMSLTMNMGRLDNPKRVELRIEGKELFSVTLRVGYWRKANQIHRWFVENTQGGADDCRRTPVSLDQLKMLKSLCVEALERNDPSVLPPQEGFFFGSTEIGEGYWEDLEETVKIVTLAEEMDARFKEVPLDFYYQSSW